MEREPKQNDDILKLCRLTYMLIVELVKEEDQEEYIELVDEVVESMKEE